MGEKSRLFKIWPRKALLYLLERLQMCGLSLQPTSMTLSGSILAPSWELMELMKNLTAHERSWFKSTQEMCWEHLLFLECSKLRSTSTKMETQMLLEDIYAAWVLFYG